jgi:hypothetical protein
MTKPALSRSFQEKSSSSETNTLWAGAMVSTKGPSKNTPLKFKE